MSLENKFLFFDYDGTLSTKNGCGISERVVTTLKEAQKKNKIFLCTGRCPAHLPDHVCSIGFDGMICSAGCYIKLKDKIIFNKKLSISKISKTIDLLLSNNITGIIEGEELVVKFGNFENCWLENNNTAVYSGKEFRKLYRKKTFNKLSAWSKIDDEIIKKIKKKFDVVKHDAIGFEFLPKGINKATAIKTVINHFNAKVDATIAFGDSPNDLEMLRFVNTGVAMGNSFASVLKDTKHITDTVDNDGVAVWLEKNL